jgi:AraC-like DNA-binding protein
MPCRTPNAATARMRLMGDSYAYASPSLVSRACRHSVTLLMAVGDEPVQVQWRHGVASAPALLVAPLVDRTLHMANTPFVLVDLEPSHACFRRIALGVAGGVHGLALPELQGLQAIARAFHARQLGGPQLDARLREAITSLALAWPEPAPLDTRAAWMKRAIDRDPCVTLESLAGALAMSPTRASRLFSAQMGIPSRAYAMAAKIRAAARYMGSARSLTEVAVAAGFADSAHFSKVWLRYYGAPPSAYFPAWRTVMDADGLPDWAGWRPPRLAPAAAAC